MTANVSDSVIQPLARELNDRKGRIEWLRDEIDELQDRLAKRKSRLEDAIEREEELLSFLEANNIREDVEEIVSDDKTYSPTINGTS